MSTPGVSLIAREAEIIGLLEEIHSSNLNYSVIGGYGVDAYSPLPRYSVDCDIVTENKELKGFDGLLKASGFDAVQTIYQNELEGVETKRYTKNVMGGRWSLNCWWTALDVGKPGPFGMQERFLRPHPKETWFV